MIGRPVLALSVSAVAYQPYVGGPEELLQLLQGLSPRIYSEGFGAKAGRTKAISGLDPDLYRGHTGAAGKDLFGLSEGLFLWHPTELQLDLDGQSS